MKEDISKKEIRKKVDSAMHHALTEIEIAEPSKKAKRLLNKVSKKLTSDVKKKLKNSAKPKKPKQQKKKVDKVS